MAKIESLCIYCGASSGFNRDFTETARQVGEAIAAKKFRLVYGGGDVGLMGAAATAALKGGSEVVGVIPQSLIDTEIAMLDVNELIVVKTMHERKAIMEKRSDAFIALPGGFGTLDELFEIITWAQLGFHKKPIGLLNVRGYFDHLVQFIDHAVQEGFIRPQHRKLIHVDADINKLIEKLETVET